MGTQTPMFLWQVPSASAALYFGDKWAEMHSFLHNRLAVQARADGDGRGQQKAGWQPVLSKKYPAWLDYVLELMRARGYFMLYPAFRDVEDSAIAAVHNELWKQPEEFAGEEDDLEEEEDSAATSEKNEKEETEKKEKKNAKRAVVPAPDAEKEKPSKDSQNDATAAASPDADKPLSADVDVEESTQQDDKTTQEAARKKKEHDLLQSLDSEEHPTLKAPVITELLQNYPAGLPQLSQLAILPHAKEEAADGKDGKGGKDVTDVAHDFIARTEQYVKDFRARYGGCKGGEKPGKRTGSLSTDDLFCLRAGEAENRVPFLSSSSSSSSFLSSSSSSSS
ncbi:hypothetical protein KEM52_003259 [Ascosphaera acerosa]|nr:hypothetical protein KEM52_003259 [Ascosphaera acerosa]